ncbi:MAG: DnaD domain protein [Clostridia bacterium]|nr:DnaD domain protein [Clostridia bacterium]
MALCSFSSRLAMEGFTVIDNTFLNEFLPQATGDDVKVYLFCLNMCNNPNLEDNCLDTICKILSLTEEQVKNSFAYWQEMGLVQIVSNSPYEIKFLPIRSHSGSNKIRKPEKYTDFNNQMNEIITGRMITPTEFNEYYSLIETYHIEPNALILIAKYCTIIKSNSIGYPYILAVARNFANEGIKTVETVEQKFLEQEQSSIEIKQVLSALGLKREADIDERNLYLKWINNYGFTQGVVLEIAKSLKKRGGFTKLNELLTKYYEQKLFTIEEITTFSEKRDYLFETAKEVCKTIGVYYQDYENVVDTYISDWDNKGYERSALQFLSHYCFKQSIRTLDGMNILVSKFYKLGLISLESIEQYISSIIENDELIKQVLDTIGLVRSVSSADRDMFKTWTENWNYSQHQILLVAKFAHEKGYNISYMNKILSSLENQNIKSDNEIEKYLNNISNSNIKNSKSQSQDIISHNYSKEQLTAVYDSLDDVEI